MNSPAKIMKDMYHYNIYYTIARKLAFKIDLACAGRLGCLEAAKGGKDFGNKLVKRYYPIRRVGYFVAER